MTGRRVAHGLALALILVMAIGCARQVPEPIRDDAARLHVQILGTRNHDRSAFTEGLEISGNRLLEGTGREGSSYVRATDLQSGAQLAQATLPANQFGEGITVSGDTVWQLTWKDGVAYARDSATLRELREVRYDGEGWGLCTQKNTGGIVMSNGSSTLTFRDPTTFAVTGSAQVTLDGEPLDRLNELECATDGSVYANIWQTNNIARIDPTTGKVTALIDASALVDSLTSSQREGIDVLNGIAEIPGTSNFLVTGKLWPTSFEVAFVS